MDFLTLDNLVTLLMLILLQAVLGFDNLLYISLESKKAPEEKRAMARKLGIGIAIVLRIALLFILVSIIKRVQDPFVNIDLEGIISASFNIHSVIVLVGGAFIIYTATREIWHMMAISVDDSDDDKGKRSAGTVIAWIVVMNLVFSFDSILSAIALTDVIWIMATAIVISGILMIWLAETVSTFLQKNRMYEVLGLFILFVVGIMLLTEGGELAHLYLFENEITHMNKTTFYFVISVLVLSDIVQSRYQRKLNRKLSKAEGEPARV